MKTEKLICRIEEYLNKNFLIEKRLQASKLPHCDETVKRSALEYDKGQKKTQ